MRLLRDFFWISFLILISGCHYSYLADERIAGVETRYKGYGSIESLAHSREVMVLTDRIDKLLDELADPKTSSERRNQIYSDLQLIQGLREQAENLIPVEGSVINNTRSVIDVIIQEWPSGEPVTYFQLVAGETRWIGLLPGKMYKFCYQDQSGREWSWIRKKPISKNEPWRSSLNSIF